jgi:hypothetical protein
MAKDYAKKYIKHKYLTPKRKKDRSLWVILGISVGLFIFGVFFLNPIRKEKTIQLAEKKVNKKTVGAYSAPPSPEPKFDFYNILPQEGLNLSPRVRSAIKEIPEAKSMSTVISSSSGPAINEMLSPPTPTPEQVAIAEAKKQLEEEMGQSSHDGYMLLLGNFIIREQAQQLQAQALLKGFPVKKKISLINGKPVYQIFLGPADVNKLTDEKRRLSEAGLSAVLIKIAQ